MAIPKEPGKSLFLRHQLKSLNLALLLYLCFGALLFDQLGEFSPPGAPNQSKQSEVRQTDKSRGAASLSELRLNSVRRMWNITNQLNILYESNWTALVLEELVGFEQQLISSIQSSPLDELEELEFEEGRRRANKLEGDKVDKLARRKRAKSIKKSIIHSLATITTIGSPNGRPKSQAAKLATILYGCLGIPLFFLTVSQTGKQLAHSSLNSLIVIRHYGFKLPAYYLCCSCSPYECLKWLSWCCCCCCCCCRFLFCITDKFFQTTKREPPRLLLMQNNQQIASQHIDGCPPTAIQQKTVRFDNSECTSFATNKADQLDERPLDDDHPNTDFRYSWGILKISSFLLLLYFLLGAYYFAQSESLSLVDSMYDCYAMLSMSELPKSFNLEPLWNPMTFYHEMRSNLAKSPGQLAQAAGQQQEAGSLPVAAFLPFDKLTLDVLYMILGLNLVSMCAHFAKLCYKSSRRQAPPAAKELANLHCNGNIATVMGSYENNQLFTDSQNQPPSLGAVNLADKPVGQQAHYGCLYQANAGSSAPATSGAELNAAGQQEQLDLAELFVINQPDSGAEGFGFKQQPQQQQQIISDVSFSSDRSANSLCLHHQQQQQQHQASPSKNILGPIYQPACELGTIQRRGQRAGHAHHQLTGNGLSQSHLYIPQTMLASNGPKYDRDQMEPTEMDRMLKSCLLQAGEPQQHQQVIRSSSSSVQLAQHMNGNRMGSTSDPNESFSSQHLQPTGNGATLSDQESFGSRSFGVTTNQRNSSLRPLAIPMALDANGCELDSSLNTIDTNSNTMSSVSSRTVKLTDQQPGPARHALPMSQNGYLYLSDESSNAK